MNGLPAFVEDQARQGRAGPAEAKAVIDDQSTRAHHVSEQLRMALHARHPKALPLDAADADAVVQQLRDTRQAREHRSDRRGRWLWTPVWVAPYTAVAIGTVLRMTRTGGPPWNLLAVPFLTYGLLLAQCALQKSQQRLRSSRSRGQDDDPAQRRASCSASADYARVQVAPGR
ncbi:hypothetical protein [Peterkaempfera bronchialis]|uniref:hypothetical protein n=1 Tax=Peterkaempfera bronchialis TaxID=2126346 RepID=UPI003C30D20F